MPTSAVQDHKMPYLTLLNISGGIGGVVSTGRRGRGILLDWISGSVQKKAGVITIYAIYFN